MVSDKGQGFDAAAVLEQSATLGLFTIRRRVELFGGQFQIESWVGLGTRVSVKMLM